MLKPDDELWGLSLRIRQLADEPTEANRQRFYAELRQNSIGLRLVEVPSGANHLSGYVTRPGDNVRVHTIKGPDGSQMLLAFADITRWHKADPTISYAEVDAKSALKLAVADGNAGIVINGIDQAWAAIQKADVEALLQEWTQNNITIPSGHKVIVVRPSSIARFGRCESGIWIADLGNERNFAGVIATVEKKIGEKMIGGEPANLLWIIQPCVLEPASVFEPFCATLASLVAQSQGILSHVTVIPRAEEQHFPQIRRMRDTGVEIFHAAEDGACFIEVHKPDGIVIGMPGKQFVG